MGQNKEIITAIEYKSLTISEIHERNPNKTISDKKIHSVLPSK